MVTDHHAAVERLEVHALTVPTDQPEADGTLEWEATTMVVVEAHADGRTGLGWTYGPTACREFVDDVLADVVVGREALDVPGAWWAMARASRNATRAGVAGYAVSAVDTALWDLKARLLDVSLAGLLGRVHDSVPVYGSGGFTSYDDERMVDQLNDWVDQGLPDVKIKIGEDRGRRTDRDLERIALARDTIGAGVGLFVDANGGYTAKQSIRVMHDAAAYGVTWCEEPVSSDDLEGLHQVREAVDCDVTAGEYGTGATYFRRMCQAQAVDCLQVDATRCGGFSEWLRSCAVADSFGLEVSAHCAPNLHAQIGIATPNLRHIEWFHDHTRIEELVLEGTLRPQDGRLHPRRDGPGNGLRLNRDAVAELSRRGHASERENDEH